MKVTTRRGLIEKERLKKALDHQGREGGRLVLMNPNKAGKKMQKRKVNQKEATCQ